MMMLADYLCVVGVGGYFLYESIKMYSIGRESTQAIKSYGDIHVKVLEGRIEVLPELIAQGKSKEELADLLDATLPIPPKPAYNTESDEE